MGPGLQLYGDAWGLELMKRYLGIIYDEAKRAKPEALAEARATVRARPQPLHRAVATWWEVGM